MTPSMNRVGSLSPRSSDSHANGRVASAAACHSASRVVLPEPTGAWTRASFASVAPASRATSRARGTRPERTPGIWIFVAVRTAPDGAGRTAVDGSETMPRLLTRRGLATLPEGPGREGRAGLVDPAGGAGSPRCAAGPAPGQGPGP